MNDSHTFRLSGCKQLLQHNQESAPVCSNRVVMLPPINSSKSLAAFRFENPFYGSRVFSKFSQRANGAANKLTVTVWANPKQYCLGTLLAKSAFKRTNHGIF
jgi:hypothetical protein